MTTRLDEALVARGAYATRSRARDAIARGTVRVGGTVATKPARPVREDEAIEIDDPARAYVSRAALKLIHGLDAFGLDPDGRHALDLGVSTGGFTQVLLERGAAHVVGLDVGRDQLDPALRGDQRVTLLEGINARDLTAADLPYAPDLVVCDVSFISLKLALPPALSVATVGTYGLFLVKPQFEVGRDRLGKGGIVRNPADGEEVAAELGRWLTAQPGWRALGIVPSPIEGGDGNREFLLAGSKYA